MSTAQTIIDSAARFAGILAENQVLESGVNDDALRRLNIMLKRWRNNGVDLGLPVLITSTTVIIDDADEEAIELQLAIRLMVRHKRLVDPGVSGAANDAFTELQAKYAIIDEMQLDRALTRKHNFTFQLNT